MSARSRTIKHSETAKHSETGTHGGVGESQLRLLPGGSVARRPDWQLDDRTRTVGRLGVEQAREILRQARPPEPKRPEPVRKAS